MNKNEDAIKSSEIEGEKTTATARKTAEKTAIDTKTRKTETAKKEKTPATETTNADMEKKLLKSIQSKKQLHIEYYGKQVSEQEIADKLFEQLKENDFKDTVKSLKIYFKVEENTAYCVVNDGEPIILNF
jgi:transcriptional regulator